MLVKIYFYPVFICCKVLAQKLYNVMLCYVMSFIWIQKAHGGIQTRVSWQKKDLYGLRSARSTSVLSCHNLLKTKQKDCFLFLFPVSCVFNSFFITFLSEKMFLPVFYVARPALLCQRAWSKYTTFAFSVSS